MSATRVGGGTGVDAAGIPLVGGPPLVGSTPMIPGHLPPTSGNLIFGAQRGPASEFGSSPTTNPLIAARFAPAIRINPIELRGPVTGGDPGWMRLSIDRPSFIWPTGYKNDGATINLPFYEVLYAPIEKPRVDSQAMRSARRGIAYLSNPGEWWVKYNAPAAAAAATLCALVIDANDPAVASRYLSEPGCNGYTTTTTVAPATVGTANLCAAANPYRKGLTIQAIPNGASTPNVRIGIGGVAADWSSGAVGLRLIGGSFNALTFAGDALTLDNVYCMSETAVAGAVITVEYF